MFEVLMLIAFVYAAFCHLRLPWPKLRQRHGLCKLLRLC